MKSSFAIGGLWACLNLAIVSIMYFVSQLTNIGWLDYLFSDEASYRDWSKIFILIVGIFLSVVWLNEKVQKKEVGK